MSAQLVLSPLFFLPSAASPPTNVITSLCRVTLPSHGAKMSLLPPLYLPTMSSHHLASQTETEVLNLHPKIVDTSSTV
jgi:hypothetical protein